jgi:Putative restriction endonuclease
VGFENVLSTGNTAAETALEMRAYSEVGVTLVWLIDSKNRTARVFSTVIPVTSYELIKTFIPGTSYQNIKVYSYGSGDIIPNYQSLAFRFRGARFGVSGCRLHR